MRFGLRELVFVLLLVGMLAASYLAVFKPRAERLEEARAEIAAKQQKLAALEQATKNIPDLGQEIDDLLAAIEFVEQQLPAEREVDVILREVWELAAKHKLKPESVRPDKEVPQAQYTELPVKITIVGNFDGFYEFLLDLEQLPRITRMPVMKLKKLKPNERGNEAKDDDGVMRAEVVLSIFFEGRQSTASADPQNTERRL